MGATWLRAAVVTATTLLAACGGLTSGTSTVRATPPGSGADSAPGTASDPTGPTVAKGRPAWVAVSVATLWRYPTAPRPVDAPALARPARISRWLADLTLAQRRALNGRADTQALLGDRVRVIRLRPGWAKVVVPDQPSPTDARGYPGWVPRRQLTATPPRDTESVATVTARLTWLRTDRLPGARVMRVSFGTRLPVVETTDRWVRVVTPGGVVRRVRASRVSVHAPGDPALPATRAGVVASATKFVGLDYLWAGRSGFGFDCSGLTSLVYRVHGRTLPRDAAPQAQAGQAVTTLRRGDLLFYATSGQVHHVAMYAGHRQMVHSPRTGSQVQVIDVDTPAYAQEYAGARRFLG